MGERSYLRLVQKIIKSGVNEKGRNGITRVCIGETMRFCLTNHKMPLLTTKKMAWKTCLRELLWFISGDTNNETLRKQNVTIWDGNAGDLARFNNNPDIRYRNSNDLGPIYGFQWRHFGEKYVNSETAYSGQDQLQNIINHLKKKEDNRRLIMSAWNPTQLSEMALPPCHVLSQFHITNGDELSCSLYQRSGDVGLGVPFNIASFSFLTHLLAHHCDLKPKEFIHHIGNAHIYDDHLEILEKQLNEDIKVPPILHIANKLDNIEDYGVDDFAIKYYTSAKKLKMKMRI